MSPAVQVLAVGAAAPAWRVAASDVGAAWGRGGKGQAAVCAPDEDVLTLAAEAAGRALAAVGPPDRHRRRAVVGHHPPAVRRGPEPRGARRAPSACRTSSGGALCSGSPHAGHGGAARRRRRRRRRLGAASRSWSSSDALVPGPGTGFEARAGARRPLRSCSSSRRRRGRRSARASRARTRSSTATAATARPTTRDLYDPRLFREEMFLPTMREVGEQLAALDSARVVAPRSRRPARRDGREAARRGDAGVGDRVRRSSATPVPRPRCSAASARSTPRARSRSSAPAAAGPPASWSPPTVPSPVPRSVASTLDRRPASVATPRCCGPAAQLVADRRDGPDGRAARERAVRPRRRRDARAARRPLRRLRHDQHAAVDPPALHQRAAARSSSSSPLARHGVVHTFVVNQTMPAPFVAPLPIAVVDLDDGARVMLQVHRRRQRPRDRHRGRARAAPLRARARRPRLRLQGACATDAPTTTTEERQHELEQGRGRRRRAHQVRRAVRAELRADGRGRVRRRGRQPSTRASSPRQVEAAFVATQRGTLWGQEGIGGNTVPTAIGLAGIPCTRIENACPSGSDAFRVGAMAVASGVHDVVLVIGVEKMRDKSTEEGLLVARGCRAPDLHPGRDRAGAVRAVRHPPHARVRHDARDARVGRGEEPLQRRARPVRALPERDHRSRTC